MTLKVEGQAFALPLLPLGEFLLSVREVTLKGLGDTSREADVLTLKAQLAEDSPMIEVEGGPRPLILTLTPASDARIALLGRSGAAIKQIDLIKQNERGGQETTLLAAGEITYPDYPKKEKVVVAKNQVIGLGDLKNLVITELSFDPEQKAIRLRLEGTVGRIQTLAGTVKQDQRLTRFDALWHGAKTAILFSIVIWVFSATLGGYKLYKELHA